ncbi:MAG: BrnT family toxin [Nitrospirae bacterium]|nr:MAG: BrnT family toxin [Nitrospirota bacterium]
MTFEWDATKNKTNKEKHGISFEEAKNLWLDENRIEIRLPYPIESRRIILGKIDNKLWTAVYTVRKGSIRIISVRRARKKEAALYDKKS